MPDDHVGLQLGDKINGEVVKIACVSKLIRPEFEYDKRTSRKYYLDREGARQLVFSLNSSRPLLATIQDRLALRLDDGRYLLLDLHERMIEISALPLAGNK